MRITARWKGRCSRCGGAIAKDTEIEYDPATKTAVCAKCLVSELTPVGESPEAIAVQLGFLPFAEAIEFSWSQLPTPKAVLELLEAESVRKAERDERRKSR